MDSIKQPIDINADVGEGVLTEEQIMPFLSSCNVACGGHYGDRATISKTVALARESGVKVGAHPSYPDKNNFGRHVLNIGREALKESLIEQLLLFKDTCDSLGVSINHIKPHGALYNEAARNPQIAVVVIEAIEACGLKHPIYTLPGGQLALLAKDRLAVIPEAFIDRSYNSDGSLLSRKLAGAVIDDPHTAWEQLYGLLKNNTVLSAQGIPVSIQAATFCVHGDTPNALKLLQHIRRQLALHKIDYK